MLDLRTLEPAAQPVAIDALRGHWEAAIAYTSGEVTNIDDVIDNNFSGYFDDVKIVVVRSTAVPQDRHGSSVLHLPTDDDPRDTCITFENAEGIDQVVTWWAQAQAMADGLNAASALAMDFVDHLGCTDGLTAHDENGCTVDDCNCLAKRSSLQRIHDRRTGRIPAPAPAPEPNKQLTISVKGGVL